MKRILSFILLICMLVSVTVCFSSCSNKTVFSLGKYEIKEDHYRYLASIHNRKQFDSYQISVNTSLEAKFESGLTVAQALDTTQQGFLNDIYMLMFSQLLFDIYDLKLTKEIEDTIESNVTVITNYYGGYSEQKFNQKSRLYGFTAKTLREVFTMQSKQRLVIEHLFGANGEKIGKEDLDDIFEKNYMCFQTIIINNVYKLVKETNDKGEEVTVMEPLNEDEIKERNDIIDDLTNLFIESKEGYEYKVIDPTMTYDEIYAYYSDDKAYPQGCYTQFPKNAGAQNAISAAALLRENDVAKVKANRFFSQGGTFEIGGKKVTVNAGDYFTYGNVFVKRLPMEEGAYDKEEFKDFFSTFKASATSILYGEHIANFQANESGYQIKDHGRYEGMPLSSVYPNDLDYNFLYGDLGKEKTESSSK